MKTLIYTFLFCLSVNVQAQEVLFSQPYSTASNINPALTGAFNAKNRLTFQYRQAQNAPVDNGAGHFEPCIGRDGQKRQYTDS